MSGPVWPVVDAAPGGVIRTSQGRAMLAADVAAWEWSRTTLYSLPHGSQPVGTLPLTLVRLPTVPSGLSRRVRVIVRRTTAGSASELEVSIGTETVTVTVGAGVGVYTATGTLPQVESGADVVFEAEVKTAAFVGTVTVHLLPATEVTPMGDNQIWIRDLFANRPTVGIDSGDLLLLTDGAEAGWVYEYDGTNWVLRRSIVSTWGDRPLPGTLPSGAVLDGDSRVEVGAIGNRSDVRFAWDAGGSLWVLESALAVTLADAFGDTTAGNRFVAYEPVSSRACMTGTSTTASSLDDGTANRLHMTSGGGTATAGTVDGFPAHVAPVGTAQRSSLITAFGLDVPQTTLLCVARGTRSTADARVAQVGNFGANGNTIRLFHRPDAPDVQAFVRRSTADGEVEIESAAAVAQNEWFACVVRGRWAAGEADLYVNGLTAATDVLPGAPANTPSTNPTNQFLEAANNSSANNGSDRRVLAFKEGAFDDDDVALAMAIMLPIRDL